jgi:prepilin-type N-terminal cleavage/methylation domain-containing protein
MKKLQGFTLVEVIVVVAVLAAVLTIATPDMARLFAKQSEITESLRMRKIYEALDTYAKAEKKTPPVSTWYIDLAEYSELSEDQIRYDTWGNARHYATFDGNKSYLGGTYKVYYASVLSEGLNSNLDGKTVPTNETAFKSFDYETDTFGKDTDNFAIKYTDQVYKVGLLEETLRRMEKLSLALEKYARVKQIEGVSANPDTSDSFIYFPNDKQSPGNYFPGVDSIDGNQNEATGLATLLGLPSYYGENALSDKTMWYISNPGPDGSNICNNPRTSAPFYPPVIMIDDTSNPC